MSLAQHVTQAEGFDYDGPVNARPEEASDQDQGNLLGTSIAPGSEEEAKAPDWQRLSYAPVDLTPDQQWPRDAAYKISSLKRCAQVVTAVLACWLASGVVFGFAALKPVLVAEGVYHDLCHDDSNEAKHPAKGDDDAGPCAKQNMKLNLFFIVASITGNLTCLLAGATLDRFGRRCCWIVASVALTVASLLMAASFSIPAFGGYIAGNTMLALGGTYLFVSSFELAHAFPKHTGTVVAFVTGAFDASAAVFLFYRMAYDASNGRFSPEKFFYGYLLVPFLIFAAEMSFMPANGYHTMHELEGKIEKAQDHTRDAHPSDEEVSDGEELTRVRSVRAERRMTRLDRLEDVAGDPQHRQERIRTEEDRQEASGVWGVLHRQPLHRQILSPWYLLILLQTSIQMFRMNYFIATVRTQYTYMLGSEAAAVKINHFFDAALPIGGVFATPIIAMLLNTSSVARTSGILTFFIVAIGILNCLPFVWAGYATVLVFVLFRPLYYSAISDYAAKVFGFATFGRIYGTLICISGLTNFLQSGVDAVVYGPLSGNPIPVNMVLGAAGVLVGISLTIFVSIRGRVFVQEKTDMETDQETRRLLAEDEAAYGTQ